MPLKSSGMSRKEQDVVWDGAGRLSAIAIFIGILYWTIWFWRQVWLDQAAILVKRKEKPLRQKNDAFGGGLGGCCSHITPAPDS